MTTFKIIPDTTQSTLINIVPDTTVTATIKAQVGSVGPTGPTGATGPGVASGGTAGQLLAKIDDTNYNTEWIDNYANWTSQLKHEVKLGEAITKGQAVYVSSADGANMIVSKASNATEGTSSKTMGLLETGGSTNAKVKVITEGLLSGLNTNSANAGDPVWLGTNGDLIYGLVNKPVAPAHLVFIGVVTRKNANNGEIFVKPQNGFELKEIHDVLITNPLPNQVLTYDSATQLWKNATNAAGGVTSITATAPLTGGTITSTGSIGLDQTEIYQGNIWTNPNDYTLDFSGSSSFQSILGSTTRAFTMVAGSTYEVELYMQIAHTFNSNTTSTIAFQWRTATASGSPVTSVAFFNNFSSTTVQTALGSVTVQRNFGAAGNVIIPAVNGATPSRFSVVQSKGQIRIGGTGTVTIFPGISTSVITDNGVIIYKGYFMKITRIGSDTMTNLGTWTA